MELMGYSERGAVTALLYTCLQLGVSSLSTLLARVAFPGIPSSPLGKLVDASIFLEPSFSQFGDADAVILLDRENGKQQALFIEAKVSNHQKSWTLYDAEFKDFQHGIGIGKPDAKLSSKLFGQLYFKARLAQALQRSSDLGILQAQMPPWSSRTTRKLGHNPTVKALAKRLIPYCADSYYIALVPTSTTEASEFHRRHLESSHDTTIYLSQDDIRRHGYLCWSEVEVWAESLPTKHLLKTLRFNGKQIH